MARKAALGFKYLSLEGEMMLPDEKDFEDFREGKRLTSHEKEKLRKRKCYYRHRDQYNRQRRIRAAKIANKYKAARRFALFRKQGWNFTEEDWEKAWVEAGKVFIPGSQTIENPQGTVIPAFGLRGTHRYNSTCMQRKDATEPWGPSNYKIMYRGEELKPGSKWYRE